MSQLSPSDNFSTDKLANKSPFALVALDDNGLICYANESAGHVFHTPLQELVGLSLDKLNQSDDVISALNHGAQAAVQSQKTQQNRIPIMCGSGLQYFQITFHPEKNYTSLYFQNVSSLVDKEHFLRSQATHDALTGLFNRQQLFTMGAQDIARSRRYKYPVSLLVICIDNIRQINQTYGYNMGDHVLISVSRVLQELLRESDYVARLDNKSFVISLLDASLQQTEIVAKRVMRAIEEQDIRIADTSIPVEILCGGAQFDSTQDQLFDDLLLRAENNCQSD